jgi:hypothetical protein
MRSRLKPRCEPNIPELTSQEKLDGLKSKILDGQFTTHIKASHVPIISPNEVFEALVKTNRQAANAIDGWTKDMLLQVIDIDREIAVYLGVLLHWALTHSITPFCRNVLVLSRGIAIPKPDGGIRPISVSSLILKLLGSICTTRDGKNPSSFQYAIGVKEGHKRIVHKLREKLRNNPSCAVLRFDIKNAFGTMPRKTLEAEVLKCDPSLQNYFRLVYGSPSPIALYNPETTNFITIGEGVKQGDATSSLLFCLGLDNAIHLLSSTLTSMGIQANIFAYMDDLTIIVDDPLMANRVIAAAIHAFSTIGLHINEDKSKIFTNTAGNYSIPQAPTNSVFTILGCNVNDHPDAISQFCDTQIAKHDKYFNLMRNTPLHPQIKFTMLRICGGPRIHYLCATTPPDDITSLTHHFDHCIKKMVEEIVDPSGNTFLPHRHIHDNLAFPCYTQHRTTLYAATKKMTLQDEPFAPRVSLITTSEPTMISEAQRDSQWLHYEAHNYLHPATFSMAIAIRLGVLPHYARSALLHTKCNCGTTYTDEQLTIDHILKCDQSTHTTHTVRHDTVKDSIIQVMRNYGITTTREPRCFVYEDGVRHRPDILFHTRPCGIATDLTLVAPERILSECEKQKNDIHAKVCAKHNTIFIPLAMHTLGTLGTKAEYLIQQLSKAVIPALQFTCARNLKHSIAIAAARGRADAIINAADRRVWQ